MLRNLVELARGRATDCVKAHAYLRMCASDTYGACIGGDGAAEDTGDEPSIIIGTARGSQCDSLTVTLPLYQSRHATILGSTGSGKTKCSEHQFAEHLWLGAGVGEIDFKNDLHPACLRWVAAYAYGLPKAQLTPFIRSLPIVDPFAVGALPPFNVCHPFAGWSRDVQCYEIANGLSRLFEQGFTFHQENILRHLLVLLMEHHLTLVEAPTVLQDELLRGILVQQSQSEAIREFFFRTYNEVPTVAKQALCTRLQSLLLPENVRLMFGADSIIDLRSILDHAQPLLVFLGKGNGVPEEQAELLAGLFLNLFFQAAYSSSRRLRPYTMILDEFFHILTPALTRRFNSALTTLRSYSVNLMLVLHTFSQVEPSLREAILGNCDVLGIFRTSGKNAEWLGDFLPNHDPELAAELLRRSGEFPSYRVLHAAMTERLQRLPNRHCYWYNRRQPHRAILLRVPEVLEPHEAIGIHAGALDRFIRENGIDVGGYALPKNTLRAQVAARQERLRQLVLPPIRIATIPDEPPAPASLEARRMKRRPQLG
jgi:hypothetical protein